MAQSTVYNLIPQTAWPGPAGTTTDLYGQQYQAAAYYLANRDLQTITWNFESSFIGIAKIQASLVSSPSTGDWFDVYNIDTSSSYTGFTNLSGNFVWIRAVVLDWEAGAIRLVTVSY
jgi:hypothetical protein